MILGMYVPLEDIGSSQKVVKPCTWKFNMTCAINKLQMKLLATLWSTLKNNGLLVYATCSVLNQENSNLIKKFIKKHSECNLKPIIAKWGFDTGYGRQILSGQDNMDGFFYACLKKNIKC